MSETLVENMPGSFCESRTFWEIIEKFLYRIIVREFNALDCCFLCGEAGFCLIISGNKYCFCFLKMGEKFECIKFRMLFSHKWWKQ